MSTLPLFLTQSRRYLELQTAMPQLRGAVAERWGFPVVLAAFAGASLLALARNF